jgi:hypothetical protein
MTKLQTSCLCATCEDKGHQPRMPIPFLCPVTPPNAGCTINCHIGGLLLDNADVSIVSLCCPPPPRSLSNKVPPTAPALPPSQCADPPLGCSASDYMALLADALGFSSANEAHTKLYNCVRHGKVNACQAILTSGPGGGSTLHAPMTTQGLCNCSSPMALLTTRQMGP